MASSEERGKEKEEKEKELDPLTDPGDRFGGTPKRKGRRESKRRRLGERYWGAGLKESERRDGRKKGKRTESKKEERTGGEIGESEKRSRERTTHPTATIAAEPWTTTSPGQRPRHATPPVSVFPVSPFLGPEPPYPRISARRRRGSQPWHDLCRAHPLTIVSKPGVLSLGELTWLFGWSGDGFRWVYISIRVLKMFDVLCSALAHHVFDNMPNSARVLALLISICSYVRISKFDVIINSFLLVEHYFHRRTKSEHEIFFEHSCA
ncbi:uncharacterized protein LOC130138496 [Syzygium oleosum]|uniref:uncharacterized protein LOC130138496 n=1 Tax=Syzygium oleosum TaxID=219896 RepID=UPI0024B8837C|nr:uncharacterized protein LOC130138496 [Syzygium oleosum]